jgi:hypothetical protein
MALILACTMSDILVNIPILISPIRLMIFPAELSQHYQY